MTGAFGPASRGNTADVTYWAPDARNDYNELSFVAPIVLKGRWTQDNQQVTLPSGLQIVSKAVVYVDRDIAIGGYLLSGVSSNVDPHAVGALEVQQFLTRPDLRFMETQRRAYL